MDQTKVEFDRRYMAKAPQRISRTAQKQRNKRRQNLSSLDIYEKFKACYEDGTAAE